MAVPPPCSGPLVSAIMNLTKGPLDVVSEPDRPARETDENETIKITDEMREAGGRIIYSFDREIEYAEDCAEEVYRAMDAAKKAAFLKKAVE